MQHRLNSAAVQQGLQQLNGWDLDAHKASIHKEWQFRSFKTAMDFFVHVGELAETLDHHPELLSNYTQVRIWLTTHDAHGLTHLDFEMAEQIDRLVAHEFSGLLK
jgi:4a-hydroxytetrahydrobiopterin dehydratase